MGKEIIGAIITVVVAVAVKITEEKLKGGK